MSEQPQQVPQRHPPSDPRIQAMMQVLLEHQREICQHPIGSLEMHFNREALKVKLILNLPA